ncbi:hypothetical protein [Mucilaginibacter ginkgonis]|uniref:Uncharacterized protein n=1 Tax=Mucilaginibacter ginkgonis TaxID=2682091 RepID=A0A6I4I1W6_9SPHI|nr:hypothetical protein [Mucilaginibacter ginkgonis]QQL50862.1 hypothetical protein GO620_005230 [Mucilaginibacter ginkgonis]
MNWLKSQFEMFAIIASIALLISSCKKDLTGDTVIYSNDFEKSDLTNINNGYVEIFNGNHVLGRYFNGYFELNLKDLPVHNQVNISFDLYIHDSWDGNANYSNNYNGPDLWKMSVDSATYIYTTFSNVSCPVGYICPPQSYPGTYPATNNPRTGSYANLPAACLNKGTPDGTSVYTINKTIAHTKSTVLLKCADYLKENGVADRLCSESWSVDNLKVTLIK